MGREEVKRALSILSKYVDSLEAKDPQFLWISKVVKEHGLKALPVIVGNALVSYRLAGTGEQYWEEFGKFFLNHEPTIENLKKFVKESKYNKAMKEQKVKRIERASRVLEKLTSEKYSDLNLLREELKRALGAKGNEKTLVFALKMAYYAFKAMDIAVKGDTDLPIDSRIATITCSSELLDASVDEIMGKRRDEAIRVWKEIAGEVGLKALHLDALLWLPARGLRRALCKGLEEGRKTVENNLKQYGIAEAEKVAQLLVRRACC